MKIVALVQSPDHVCCRYRIAPFAQALQAAGAQLQLQSLAPGALGRLWQFRQLRSADAVWLQRRLLPCWQIAWLRRNVRVLIYDFDDAIFLGTSARHEGLQVPAANATTINVPREHRLRLVRFWATLQAADAVTAGNSFLLRQAAQYTGGEKLIRVPTCVQPELYRPVAHVRRGADVRVAWIGSKSTLPSIQEPLVGIAQAAARLGGLSMRVICDVFPQVPGLNVVQCRWSAATEAADLAQADIGLSWLPDQGWGHGKCGLKVLQYYAAGLPVIANPVGVHKELILDHETGLLARTPAEVAAAVQRLAVDPGLRARLGQAGRQRAEQLYSVSRWGNDLARWMTGTIALQQQSLTARPLSVAG